MIGAEHSPGMEVHNGTLGIGLSTAAGLAWGRKRKGEPGEVCVFMSDGEVQEGQTWEAVQAAAFHRIDNLWAIMDVNRQQCDGAMDSVMEVGDIAAKLRQFGAVVAEVDAHDLAALREAAATASRGTAADRPRAFLADAGDGVPRRRFPRLHYVRFKSESERREMNVAIAAELGVAPVDLGDR